MDGHSLKSCWKLYWGLIFIVLLFHDVAPAYALTACQNIQQRLDWYAKHPPNQYCKYVPEYGEKEIKIWQECDYCSVTQKNIKVSAGGVDKVISGRTACCRKTYCYKDDDFDYVSYTHTYYKHREDREYCDGHIVTTEYPFGGNYFNYSCYSGGCNNQHTCNTSEVFNYAQSDCKSCKSRGLIATFKIPDGCNCYDEDDLCCENSSTCCRKREQCCRNDCCDNPPQTCPPSQCSGYGGGGGSGGGPNPPPSGPSPTGPGPSPVPPPSPDPIGGPFIGFGASGISGQGEGAGAGFCCN